MISLIKERLLAEMAEAGWSEAEIVAAQVSGLWQVAASEARVSESSHKSVQNLHELGN